MITILQLSVPYTDPEPSLPAQHGGHGYSRQRSTIDFLGFLLPSVRTIAYTTNDSNTDD